MAETFFGVSMIPMNYKDEVRQIKSELLFFIYLCVLSVNFFHFQYYIFRNCLGTSCATIAKISVRLSYLRIICPQYM